MSGRRDLLVVAVSRPVCPSPCIQGAGLTGFQVGPVYTAGGKNGHRNPVSPQDTNQAVERTAWRSEYDEKGGQHHVHEHPPDFLSRMCIGVGKFFDLELGRPSTR